MNISSSPRAPQQRRYEAATDTASALARVGSKSSPKLGDFSSLLKISRITPLSLTFDTCKSDDSPSVTSPSERPVKATKRAVKLFDLDHPVFARLQVSQSARTDESPEASSLRSADPPSPSPVLTEKLTASHQEFSPKHHPDLCMSSTDEDAPLDDSDGLNDIASHTSTPTTSPATSVNHNAEQESSVVFAQLMESSFKKELVCQSQHTLKQFNIQISAPSPPPPVLSRKKFLKKMKQQGPQSLGQFQRLDRIRVADLVAAAKESFSGEPLALPWDTEGNYLIPRPSDTRDVAMPRDFIEPFYRVSYKTKLRILKAAMKETYDEDERIRAHPWSQAVTNEPIHVYIDLSNIIIGFYNHIKSRRSMAPDSRARAPPFSFHAFAATVERGRPCAKRAIAGSVRSGSGVPAYMLEAEGLGYEMNILQRVRGAKKSVQNLFLDPVSLANSPYAPPPYLNNTSDSEDGAASHRAGWREQAVDEILHLKMMQSLLDTEKPATIVLCTGDAAEAEFSDGFLRNVERALSRGWYVEVVGWRDTMADAWFQKSFRQEHGWRFRTVVLDDVVEELLAIYA